jgi:hypothetical protein
MGEARMRANQRLMSGLSTVDRFGKLANNKKRNNTQLITS